MLREGREWDGEAGTRVGEAGWPGRDAAGVESRIRPRRQTELAALPQRISLAILFFAYWCVDIVSPALPAIQESLALSATGAGLVFSVFFAGRLVTNLPGGMARRASGPKWTAVAGLGGASAWFRAGSDGSVAGDTSARAAYRASG